MSSQPSPSGVSPQSPSFGERYELLKKLGTGGMGAVFMANDKLLGKVVAVKILLPGLSSEAVVRFQQEAKAAAKLDHRNVIKVLDFGSMPSGDLYLVMDYIDGRSLDQRLKAGGAMPLSEALPVFIQICAGLAHAHSHGILHRDIKPSNVMLPEDPSRPIQIVDFSIAKMQSDEQKLTSTGTRIGSPLYMSPEQASGLAVDARSDIFSLGLLMYKTLTNELPLMGETYMETVLRHKEEDAPLLNENKAGLQFPKALEIIVSKALARDRNARFENADQLNHSLASLQEQLAYEVPAAPHEPSTEVMEEFRTAKTERWMKSSVILACVWGVAFLIVAAVVLFQVKDRWWRTDTANSERHVISKKEFSDAVMSNLEDKIDKDLEYEPEKRAQYFDTLVSSPVAADLINKDPQLKRALADGSLKRKYMIEAVGKLNCRRIYHNYMWWDLLELWGDPSLSEVWTNRQVVRFVESPELWRHWNDEPPPAVMVEYKKNPGLLKLMQDGRFTSLLVQENFVKLVKEPGFKTLIEDPIQVKFRTVLAQSERAKIFRDKAMDHLEKFNLEEAQPFLDSALPVQDENAQPSDSKAREPTEAN